MNSPRRTRRLFVASGAALAAFAGATTIAVAAGSGAFSHPLTVPNGACSVPALKGTVVTVTLTNMRSKMMLGPRGGMMRLFVDRRSVPSGTVSFRVANAGTLAHELVVLPLPARVAVGERVLGSDDRVDETGSLGEASNTCGAGAGKGIEPGAMGWTTLHLARGRYELVCNVAGHYAAGMHALLVVS